MVSPNISFDLKSERNLALFSDFLGASVEEKLSVSLSKAYQ